MAIKYACDGCGSEMSEQGHTTVCFPHPATFLLDADLCGPCRAALTDRIKSAVVLGQEAKPDTKPKPKAK